MALRVRDHRGFQRATLATAAACGAADILSTALVGDGLVFVWATAAGLLGWWELRRAAPRRWWPSVGIGVALAAGLLLAWMTGEVLVGPAPLRGALIGLVASLGLLGGQLERVHADPVLAAFTAAHAALGADERALGERAVAANGAIAARAAGLPSPDARALAQASRDLGLQVVALLSRCRALDQESAAFPADVRAQRLAELTRRRDEAADAEARESWTRAAAALHEQEERWASLRAAGDRLRARLHLQVALLESTAVALAAGQASATADEAAALSPFVDRLRDAGDDVHAQALALAEAGRA